jgi:hypothetical protein
MSSFFGVARDRRGRSRISAISKEDGSRITQQAEERDDWVFSELVV